MTTITIPKKEYKRLVEVGLRYERLREAMEDDLFAPPPTRDMKHILEAVAGSKKYSRRFIESLKRGLERSSYFRS